MKKSKWRKKKKKIYSLQSGVCPRKFNVGAKGAERDKKIQKRPDPK